MGSSIDPRGIPSINVLTLKYVGFFCGGVGEGEHRLTGSEKICGE